MMEVRKEPNDLIDGTSTSVSHSPGFDIPSILSAARNIILLPKMSASYECVICHKCGCNILSPHCTKHTQPWLLVLFGKVWTVWRLDFVQLAQIVQHDEMRWNRLQNWQKKWPNYYCCDSIPPPAVQCNVAGWEEQGCKKYLVAAWFKKPNFSLYIVYTARKDLKVSLILQPQIPKQMFPQYMNV